MSFLPFLDDSASSPRPFFKGSVARKKLFGATDAGKEIVDAFLRETARRWRVACMMSALQMYEDVLLFSFGDVETDRSAADSQWSQQVLRV